MPALQRIITSTVVVVALAAISASSAAAMVVYAPSTSATGGHHAFVAAPTYSRQDKQVISPATQAPAPVTPAPRAPRFTAPSSGYTLTDAAITMGGVVALLLLALGTGVAVSRRRTHHGAAFTH